MEETANCCPYWWPLYPPAVCEDSDFPTSFLTLGIVPFLDYGHSSEGEVASHGFDLHFPND